VRLDLIWQGDSTSWVSRRSSSIGLEWKAYSYNRHHDVKPIPRQLTLPTSGPLTPGENLRSTYENRHGSSGVSGYGYHSTDNPHNPVKGHADTITCGSVC